MAVQGTILAGRYRLFDVLGDGGMARVYRAEDERLNRVVAVKTLHQHYLGQPEFVRRFEQEAQLAAGLSHPNIVSIFDVDRDGEAYFIVMEYVEGGSLKRLISRQAPLPLDRVIAITRQLGAALDTAHAHGVIHRDIKPENILLTPTEQVKVSDFGIARALTSPGQTMTGMVLGSVSYFSPEQAQGKPATAESDIYSSGIVLYEMLTARLPFAADNPLATAMQHITQQPPPPRAYATALSPAVEEVVLKALQKNPAARFHSGAALADALAAAALAPENRAPRPTPVGQPRSSPTSQPRSSPSDPRARTQRMPRAGVPPPPRRRAAMLPILLLLVLGGGAAYAVTHSHDFGGLFAGGAAATRTPTPNAGAPSATPAPGAPSPTAAHGVAVAPTSTTVPASAGTATATGAANSATPAPSRTAAPQTATATVPASATPTAKPQPTATVRAGPGAAAATIVTARNYAVGAYNTPYAVGLTDTFSANTKAIYAIAWMRNLPPHARIVVRWTYPNGFPPYVYPLKAAYSVFWVGSGVFGPGHYTITVLVNGAPIRSHHFVVIKAGAAPHSRSATPATSGTAAPPQVQALGLYVGKGNNGKAHGKHKHGHGGKESD